MYSFGSRVLCADSKLDSDFIDWIKDPANHPDHFEWLLFHPEWLS